MYPLRVDSDLKAHKVFNKLNIDFKKKKNSKGKNKNIVITRQMAFILDG